MRFALLVSHLLIGPLREQPSDGNPVGVRDVALPNGLPEEIVAQLGCCHVVEGFFLPRVVRTNECL